MDNLYLILHRKNKNIHKCKYTLIYINITDYVSYYIHCAYIYRIYLSDIFGK